MRRGGRWQQLRCKTLVNIFWIVDPPGCYNTHRTSVCGLCFQEEYKYARSPLTSLRNYFNFRTSATKDNRGERATRESAGTRRAEKVVNKFCCVSFCSGSWIVSSCCTIGSCNWSCKGPAIPQNYYFWGMTGPLFPQEGRFWISSFLKDLAKMIPVPHFLIFFAGRVGGESGEAYG